jgi:hypothetical protein
MDQKLISHIALKNAALQGTKRRSKMQTPIIEKSGRGNRKKYLSKLVKIAPICVAQIIAQEIQHSVYDFHSPRIFCKATQ